MDTKRTERSARSGEVCTCGRQATVVYVTEKFGEVPFCGQPHPDEQTPEQLKNIADHVERVMTPRPAWLPDGCPPWCQYSDMHRDGDMYDDRVHTGPVRHITLKAEDPTTYEDGKDVRQVDNEPSELDVYLIAHYREAHPRMWIGRDGTNKGVNLTLDEARKLADLLATMFAAAEGHCQL